MDDLTKEFIAESRDGLDRMERCLTTLETTPKEAAPLIAEIFRIVHTIKGTTGFLGFSRLERLAHAGENLLGSLRDGRLAVSEELVSGLLELLDALSAILQLIDETGSEGARSGDHDDELVEHLRLLNREDASDHLSATVMPISREAEDVAPVVQEAHPSVPNTGGNEKTLRIDVEILNRMMNLVGELVLTRNQMLQGASDASGNFAELARRLDSVTADLRETVMQARMQPVRNLFSKFPRMVRDLARTCGREVRLEFFGQETGLDKSLLEAIKDPLTHAVRNAIDHGIEPAPDRVLAGKPTEGLLTLRAYHQSGSVIIDVSDDGGGIALAKVRGKAVERGLVTADAVLKMSEREVLQLIFLPGFSTASAVTTVSGRGVGMDVVRSNIEKVGGSVELESKIGQGTTLRLRVPLTLAIVPALVVRSGGRSFAIPQAALIELVYIAAREASQVIEHVGSAEVYRLRGHLLPMVRLDRLLGLTPAAEPHGFYMAVLESDGCSYGLVVDDLLSPEEIVVKPLSTVLREIGLFSGATVLGNGSLALILDVTATAQRAGVKPVDEVDGESESQVDTSATESFLVFEGRVRERMALPLEAIERIESVALERIEHANGRVLLQYRGDLLPLLDEAQLLDELTESQGEAGAFVTVLICMQPRGQGGMRRMGVVVRRVLDVSEGTRLDHAAAAGDAELVLVKDRLTTILQPMRHQDGWREVA